MSNFGERAKTMFSQLRETNLIYVVGALLLAIVAVPMLLRTNAVAPPPAGPVPEVETTEAVPAVMVADEGIRSYRHRLDVMRSKNPFANHFAPAPEVVEDTTTVDLPTEEITTDVSSPDAGVVETPSETSVEITEPTNTPPSDTGSSSTPDTSGDSGGTAPRDVVTKEYRVSYRADVLVGPSGQAAKHEDVKTLSFLPSKQRPVAVFVGVTEDGERAVFMLSTDVTGSNGDGSCSPSATNCQFLTLKPGERRTITYAPEGSQPENFTLQLLGVDLVVVDKGANAIPDDADREPARTSVPSGMASWLGIDG